MHGSAIESRSSPWLGLAIVAGGLCAAIGLTRHDAAPVAAEIAPYDVRYDGVAAVVVRPDNAFERARVRDHALEVWSENPEAEELMITLDSRGADALRRAGVELEVRIPDIQALADAERERLQRVDPSRPPAKDFFADFKPFAAVDDHALRLADLHPELAYTEVIGRSIEGRPLRALHITDPDSGQDKPTIVLNGGQHAREWIAVMSTICIADRLVHRATSDERVAAALAKYEFVIVPVVNPDGYVYSWDHDRYWRKNRRGRSGVDLNRNWDWDWGGRGASRDPRSPVYAGTKAFSEPETQALRDLIQREAPVAHVDLHSFSQLILYPWAHKVAPPRDRDRFAALADRMASAIYATDGKAYKVQSGAELYPASGTLSDWAYGAQGSTSFVMELRPAPGGGGFVLPPEEIVPTCEESLAAVLELSSLI